MSHNVDQKIFLSPLVRDWNFLSIAEISLFRVIFMMNKIFTFMIICGVLFSVLTGRVSEVSRAILQQGESAVSLALSLMGSFCLWGGVMRVAPVGLFHRGGQTRQQLMDLGWEAANMAALTHGHPLGYIPAAGLAMMVNRAAYGGCPYGDGLYGIVQECTELLNEMFEDRCGIEQMTELLQDAAELSRSDLPDAMCIARLGEGWVGEEALAIAVFCCLRYQDDFSKAVIAAVNHGGDSDSTGAVAGNLLGAWLGADAIDPCWLDDLELLDVMEELARDLCDGCRADLSIGYTDAEWIRKYARNGGFYSSGMGDDA